MNDYEPPPFEHEEETAQQEQPRWKIRTLANAYEYREPTQYVVDKFLTTSSLNIFYGAPGSKKSMVLADMAMHVVSGTPWLPSRGGGIDVMQAPAFWIDMDNGSRRTDERFGAIGRANELPESAPLHYVSMPQPSLVATSLDSLLLLRDTINEVGAKLVVIDNLGLILGDAEENSAIMATVMGNLRTLAERTGAAIVIIHHSRKGGANGARTGEALRGHSSIEASVDLAVYVINDPDSGMTFLTSTKTRGVDVPDTYARFNYEHVPGTNDLALAWFDGVDPVRGDNPIRSAIIDVVEAQGTITKTKLIEMTNDTLRGKYSKTRIRAFLDDMLNVTGELSGEKGPYNAIVISVNEA